jgi:hypothetical protein
MTTKENDNKLSTSLDPKGYTFADLLTDEQKELLLSLRNKKHYGTPPFRAGDFEFIIPLEPRHDRSSVRAFKVKVISRDGKKIFSALIWHALFGSKTFRVIHWYILFNYLSRTIRKNNRSRALMRILRISTQQCGKALNQHIRPVKTIVSYFLGKELAMKYIQSILSDLDLKLGYDKPDLTKFFHLEEIHLHQKRAPDKRRIGVGYRDKGTLSNSSHEEGEPDESYVFPEEDTFVSLLKSTQEAAAFAESYDPKKRRQLLDKIRSSLEKK